MKDQTFSWQYHSICCQKQSGQQISEYSFVINSVEASKGSEITQLFPITSNYILHKGTSFLRNSKSWCLKTDKLYSRLKENTSLLHTLKKKKKKNMQQQEWILIYQMTLLVWIVGGTERTPYESNCCKSLFVCSCTCEFFVCAACSGVCVSGHQTKRLQWETVPRWIRSELQEGICQADYIIAHFIVACY